MMNQELKERRLHQVVAGSAFIFALCALPIAQQLLVRSVEPAGTVAGASTDASILVSPSPTSLADVPVIAPTATVYATKADCIAGKDQQLSDLARLLAGEQAHIQAQIDAATAQDQAGITNAKGTSDEIAAQVNFLIQDIEKVSAPYRTKLAGVESAVASQKDAISSSPCPVE